MQIPQHLFALTRAEQRVVVLIVLGLLFAAGFSRYRRAESHLAPTTSIQAKPDSKAPADESSEED